MRCFIRMQYLVFVTFALLVTSEAYNQKIARINNDYAFKMHRTLLSEDTNILTSPISYLTQLGILQLVTDGNTSYQIRNSVGYDQSVSPNQVHSFFYELTSRVRNQTKGRFNMANVMVLRSDYPTRENIENTLTSAYNASVQMYNIYKATETMKATNALIKGATGGVFQQYLISPLDSYNRLAMLNAVYFSEAWQYQFESVQRGYFYNKGKQNDFSLLPMMSIHGRFLFAKLYIYDTKITALEIPYKDGDLKMLFLLPNSTDLEELIRIEQQLTSGGLTTIVNAMVEKDVKVTVPNFELQPGHDLMWSIQFLGVRNAFNNAADFHRLSTEKRLFVTKVLHKMVLRINAGGAIAAPPLSKTDEIFVANRPFLFFIRDTKTEMILFMGRVVSFASR